MKSKKKQFLQFPLHSDKRVSNISLQTESMTVEHLRRIEKELWKRRSARQQKEQQTGSNKLLRMDNGGGRNSSGW